MNRVAFGILILAVVSSAHDRIKLPRVVRATLVEMDGTEMLAFKGEDLKRLLFHCHPDVRLNVRDDINNKTIPSFDLGGFMDNVTDATNETTVTTESVEEHSSTVTDSPIWENYTVSDLEEMEIFSTVTDAPSDNDTVTEFGVYSTVMTVTDASSDNDNVTELEVEDVTDVTSDIVTATPSGLDSNVTAVTVAQSDNDTVTPTTFELESDVTTVTEAPSDNITVTPFQMDSNVTTVAEPQSDNDTVTPFLEVEEFNTTTTVSSDNYTVTESGEFVVDEQISTTTEVPTDNVTVIGFEVENLFSTMEPVHIENDTEYETTEAEDVVTVTEATVTVTEATVTVTEATETVTEATETVTEATVVTVTVTENGVEEVNETFTEAPIYNITVEEATVEEEVFSITTEAPYFEDEVAAIGIGEIIPTAPENLSVKDSDVDRVIEVGVDQSKKAYEIGTNESASYQGYAISVVCFPLYIQLNIRPDVPFSGLVFPINMAWNYQCFGRYENEVTNFTYRVPLKGCRTEVQKVTNGVDYVTTLIIQPHLELHTSEGVNYKVRCHYPSVTRTLESRFKVNYNRTAVEVGTKEVVHEGVTPELLMRFYHGDMQTRTLAQESVVGEPLIMIIAMENYEVYHIKIVNCAMHDGMEESFVLIDEEGCPTDLAIMRPLSYSTDLRFVHVEVTAHKFLFTNIVNFKCDVKFCNNPDFCGEVPPQCDLPLEYVNRSKAQQVDEEIRLAFHQENARKIVDDHFNNPDPVSRFAVRGYQVVDETTSTTSTPQHYRRSVKRVLKDDVKGKNLTYSLEYNLNMKARADGKFVISKGKHVVPEGEAHNLTKEDEKKTGSKLIKGVAVNNSITPEPEIPTTPGPNWHLIWFNVMLTFITAPILLFLGVGLYKGYQVFMRKRAEREVQEEGMEMRAQPPLLIPRVRGIRNSIRRVFQPASRWATPEGQTNGGFQPTQEADRFSNQPRAGNDVYY